VRRAELPVTTSDHEVRTFGDRYVLGEQIVSGQATEVWRAHDDVVGRPVALKLYFGPGTSDPAWRLAFSHQASRLVALSQPGIAKVYESGHSEAEVWLAMAYVADAEQLSARVQSSPLPAAAALNLVGQTAIALNAAHDAGIVHGALTADNLLIRPDDVVAIVGFAMTATATRADDLAALGDLADDLLRDVPDLPADVADFVGWLTTPDRQRAPGDAGEIGRAALALSASLAGGPAAHVTPGAASNPGHDTDPPTPPAYDDTERKRVRNRLIALAVIVVLFGAVLILLVGRGGGQTTVPDVVGLTLQTAQDDLTTQGLHVGERTQVSTEDSDGTVISESPRAGEQVKAGSTVTLTIAESHG
jgi:serine/threonine protein kinase